MSPKLFFKPSSSASRPESAPETAAPQQPAMPNVRKTSHLPGGLRDLADKVTARKHGKSAKSLSDTQLLVKLSSDGLSGRDTRAVHREAKKRVKEGRLQWPQQPHTAAQTAAASCTGAAHQNGTSVPAQDGANTTLAELLGMPVPPRRAANHAEARHAASTDQEAAPHATSASSTPDSSFRHDGKTSVSEAHAEPAQPLPVHTEETARPDHAAAAHAEGRHAPPAGPVLDPDTGALDKARLRQMVDALKNALPMLPANLARSHARSDGLRAKLMHQLSGISAVAADNTRKAPHEVGLAVRDTFAAAARTAHQLAKSLGGHDLADPYRGIAALLNEFKRTHLSGSANEVMSHYAGTEARNLERKAPGISLARAGSNVGTTTSASLAYSAFPTNRYAGAHVSVEAGGGKGTYLGADDDGDVNYWPSVQAYAKVSLGGNVGKWAAKLAGKLNLSGGNVFFDTVELDEMVKLLANRDANHAWVKSAGPNARRVMQQLESLANLTSKTVGRNDTETDGKPYFHYTETAGKPYFLNDAKIAKGFNDFKMTLLAASIDEKLGGSHFSALVGAAYPPLADVVVERVRTGQALPAPPRRDMPDFVVAYGEGFLAYRQATATVSGSLGNETHGNSALEAGGTFGLSARANVVQFFTESTLPPHTLLNPGYHKDYKATFKLHQQLDEVCGEPPPAQLYLYSRTRKALNQLVHAGPALPFTDAERLLYGDEAKIPAQFRNAITFASREQLDHATDQVQHISTTYLLFLKNADIVLANHDGLPKGDRETLRQHQEAAFADINQAVWQGRYSMKEALSQPKAFVSKSYAAIGLALGCVGTHISVIKQQMAQRVAPGQQPEADEQEAIYTADSMYKIARELLDKTYLPIKNHDINKGGPLQDKALWRRWDAAVDVQASGGAQTGLLGTIVKRLHGSTSQIPLGDLTGSLSVGNSAEQVSLTAEARFLYADRQPTPSRAGKFWQFTFTAQGGAPITGTLVNQAVKAAIEKFAPNLRLQDETFDPHELIRQTQGLLFDITDGTSIIMKMRKAPDVENAAMQLQFVRVLRNKNIGVDLSLTVPTPVGTFTPAVSHSDSTQSLAGEAVGPDLSYLMMQHPHLAKVVDDPANQAPADLRRALDANPVLRDRYLAIPHIMVDKVQEYADAQREIAAAAAENRPVAVKNEFVRFYAVEPFARVAKVLTQVGAHAPGSTAKGEASHQIAEPLAKPIDVGHLDLPAMRARLQALQTIEDRADYLCNAGRPLLVAFSKIMDKTRQIHRGALFHADERNTGVQTLLRDPKGLQRENARTEAALQGKPRPTSTAGELRARLQPATATVKQANLADLQQLARMSLPIAQKAQHELQRRKEHLGQAFPGSNEPAAS